MFLSYLECTHGFFGTQCKEHCRGHCMNNESCSHVSGTCSRGCQDGYTGEYCNNCKMNIVVKQIVLDDFHIQNNLYSSCLNNLACKFGYYGQNCSRICSVNCKTCQHTVGLCSCTAGWHGFHCNKGNNFEKFYK